MHKSLIFIAAFAVISCAKGQEGNGDSDSGEPAADSHVVVDTAVPDSPKDVTLDVADAIDSSAPPDAIDASETIDATSDVGSEVVDALDADADAHDAVFDALDAGPTRSILLLGCDAGALMQASYTAGVWSTIGTTGATCKGAPALAPLASGAVAVARASDDSIVTARYASSWSTFAKPFAATSTLDRPWMTSTSTGAYLVFLDGANKMQGTSYDDASSAWSTTFEPLPGAFGPSGPTVANVAGTLVSSYKGSDTFLYVASRSASGWSASTKIGSTVFTTSTLQPQIVATGVASPDAEIVYAGSDDELYVSLRIGGVFGAATKIAPGSSDASTNVGFSVTRASSGAIVVAFVGKDGKAYGMTQPTPGGTFTAAAPVDVATDVGSVALTNGVAEDAMLVMGTSATGPVRWSALTGSTWSAALLVPGGSIVSPSLTTTP